MPPGNERADSLPHLVAAPRVEPRGRLVQEHHRRGEDEAGREIQPPAHAPGIILRLLAGRIGEPETLQEIVRPPTGLPHPQMIEPAEGLQVLTTREDLVHRRVLPRQAYAVTDLFGLAHHVEPRDLGPATVRPEQSREYPHRRGLPSPVRPEQPAHPALRYPEIQASQSLRLPEALL